MSHRRAAAAAAVAAAAPRAAWRQRLRAVRRRRIGSRCGGGVFLFQTSVCTQAFGGEQLLQLLKKYSRSAGLKTSITVGVVGYPNVGTPRRQHTHTHTRTHAHAHTHTHTHTHTRTHTAFSCFPARSERTRTPAVFDRIRRYSLSSNPLVFTRCSDDAAPTAFQP